MLTTTLPLDDFFAAPSNDTSNEPWLVSLATILAPVGIQRLLLANSNRELLYHWESGEKTPSTELNINSLPRDWLVVPTGEDLRYQPFNGGDLVIHVLAETVSPLGVSICLLQLAQGKNLATISSEERDALKNAFQLVLTIASQKQNLDILSARNKQLIRQHEAFEKEHKTNLEASLHERDERIKEQRSYLDRLEREVALRTLELRDQTCRLHDANERMKRNLNSAARIQTALLPKSLPKRSNIRFSWRFRPCDELAGDSLNVFPLDEEHLGLYVLDVSGHGVPSALLSVTLSRFLLPTSGQSSLPKVPIDEPPYYQITPPTEVANQLNHLFPMNETTEQYFTIIYGVLNTKTLEFRYVSAGHPGLVYCPRDAKAEMRDTESFAIGWFDEVEYDEHTIQLKPGDRIYIYTDGITESANAERVQFGNEKLLGELDSLRNTPLDDSVEQLLEEVVQWTGQRSPQDDLSILAVEIGEPVT